jgi:hypothetical protein
MTMKIYIDGIEHQATPNEIAEIETRQAEGLKQQETEAKEAAAKAKAKSDVLAKLGLTVDEINVLFS